MGGRVFMELLFSHWGSWRIRGLGNVLRITIKNVRAGGSISRISTRRRIIKKKNSARWLWHKQRVIFAIWKFLQQNHEKFCQYFFLAELLLRQHICLVKIEIWKCFLISTNSFIPIPFLYLLCGRPKRYSTPDHGLLETKPVEIPSNFPGFNWNRILATIRKTFESLVGKSINSFHNLDSIFVSLPILLT